MDDLDDLVDFLDHQTPNVRSCIRSFRFLCSDFTSPVGPPPHTHTHPQIKQHAAELVQGLTGSPEGISQLASRADRLVPALFRLVGSGIEASSRPALTSLVNLSQEPHVQQKLLDLNGTARCMDYLKEKACPGQEGLLVMLMANLTASEQGAEALLQLGKPGVEGLNMAILLKLFLDNDIDSTYDHVASILPNVTRFITGRQLLLQPGRGTFRALASQLRSKNELRRGGCAGAIKNCCFSCEEDGTVDAIAADDADEDALHDILGVLAGIPTVEMDDGVRENLAEAVLCLAKVPAARKKLWAVNAPELLRKAYEMEEHRGVCEALEGAAEFFLQDGFEPDPAVEVGNCGDGDDGTMAAEEETDQVPQQQQQQQHPHRPDVHIQELD